MPDEQEEELNIVKVLRKQRDGELLQELQDKVSEALNASIEEGKASTITLQLTISPKGKTVSLSDDIKAKIPKPPKSAQTWFWQPDMNFSGNLELVERDPNQRTFDEVADFESAAKARDEEQKQKLKEANSNE